MLRFDEEIQEDSQHSLLFERQSVQVNCHDDQNQSIPTFAAFVVENQPNSFNAVELENSQSENILANHDESSSEFSTSEESDSESDDLDDSTSCSTCTDTVSSSSENIESVESGSDSTERDELCMIILSYVSKHKLSGTASQDLINLLRIIDPKYFQIHHLSIEKIKQTLGNCEVNLYDYCGQMHWYISTR